MSIRCASTVAPAILVALASGCNWASSPRPKPPQPPSAKLEAAVEAAAGALRKLQREDGSFIYRVNLDPSVRVKAQYNLLRHAGAVYALAQHAERTGDPASRKAALAGARYLLTTLGPVPGRPEQLAVWSPAKSSNNGRTAKLGGTGLGLVALESVQRLVPDATEAEVLARMARFILGMQKADGSFYSKFFEHTGPDDAWTSLYYPGEAALGLILAYERVKDPKLLAGAEATLVYLTSSRATKTDVPADHWALIATARLLRFDPAAKQALLRHARQVSNAILVNARAQTDPRLSGALTADTRSTPTATRLEGLVAIRPHLAGSTLASGVDRAIAGGVAFLVRRQVAKGPYAGSWTRQGAGPRRTEVRIDYIQHALSALLMELDRREAG